MKILMVCLGNICRSPLAEGILKSKLPSTFTVDSAGTIDMHEGKKPDARSIKMAHKHGIDISQQKSKAFGSNDLQIYDRIYCMDRQNFADVMSYAQSDLEKEKIFMILGAYQDVPDPYWGEEAEFENVYQLLENICTKIAGELLNKNNE